MYQLPTHHDLAVKPVFAGSTHIFIDINGVFTYWMYCPICDVKVQATEEDYARDDPKPCESCQRDLASLKF